MPEKTFVYRIYADDGPLLYVGQTSSFCDRMSAHAREKPWWQEAVRIEATAFPSRDDALIEEERLIKELQPYWNKQIPCNFRISQQRWERWKMTSSEEDRTQMAKRIAEAAEILCGHENA